MSMRDFEVLSSIDPITTTSTGDTECVSVSVQVTMVVGRENQRMSMRDLEVLSSIDPITTTSTGDNE